MEKDEIGRFKVFDSTSSVLVGANFEKKCQVSRTGFVLKTVAISEQSILQQLMNQRDRISAAAWLVVRDAHIAEDIYQNVAIKAMGKEVAFDSEGALMSWAFITARREGIDWLRRQKNAPVSLDESILEVLEAEWAKESLGQTGGRSQALRDCLDELPERSRELLKLRYFDGQQCEEVASLLGAKLDAIYKRLSRLHNALKDCIETKLNQAVS
ncbi:MAG: sigma-70 family RNA polymerase sigma factor [Verrucomicrobiota bacterium]|nr:sigma-70 family RNA polymerase sigma factor [Verrucomicrobiota bacterium]